ncbi:MAG: hypothetical protein AAF487_07820 [Bacteroidota bacterium]
MKCFLYAYMIFSFFIACNPGTNAETVLVLDDLKKGHFAGVSIGDSAIHVSGLLEDSIVLENTNEILFLTQEVDQRFTKREIRTAIDRSRIYEISIDFFMKSDSMTESFFMECKEMLDLQYGKSDMDEGYANWRSASVNKKVIEIELFNESMNSDMPLVSINFYEDFDKSFYAE